MKYLLTIQAEFEADDDPSARGILRNKLLENIAFPKNIKPEIKLRCIYEDKQPRLVNNWLEKGGI